MSPRAPDRVGRPRTQTVETDTKQVFDVPKSKGKRVVVGQKRKDKEAPKIYNSIIGRSLRGTFQ